MRKKPRRKKYTLSPAALAQRRNAGLVKGKSKSRGGTAYYRELQNRRKHLRGWRSRNKKNSKNVDFSR